MTEPVGKIRAGQVSCAIWENEASAGGRTFRILRATVERRYTDRTGAWKSSGSFSRNEIPQAVYCLIKAYAMMMEQGAAKEDEDGSQ